MKYFRKIQGEKCYLSPINGEDIDKCTEWFNDIETAMGLGEATQGYSLTVTKGMLESFGKKSYHFAILTSENDQLIGYCWLNNVNLMDRSAELAILIGDKNYRGKGYGEEAVKLMLDYSFNIANFNNIMLSVYSHNKGAIRCYEKCGFKIMGVRRKSHIVGRKHYDEIYMDIIAEEFEGQSVTDEYLKS